MTDHKVWLRKGAESLRLIADRCEDRVLPIFFYDLLYVLRYIDLGIGCQWEPGRLSVSQSRIGMWRNSDNRIS